MKKSEIEIYEEIFRNTMGDIANTIELALDNLELKDYKEAKELLSELLFTIDQYRIKKD